MRGSQNQNRANGHTMLRRTTLCAAVAAVFAAPLSAVAFEINTNNEDLAIRWDNTFRYNLGMRAQSQDQAILGAVNNDDGDRNFANGKLVANRLDVLSEFDFIYKRNFGFRVSYAGWYDAAYKSLSDTSNATANTLVNGLPVAGALSPYTKRYAEGVSGEWLDAFGFGTFDVAGIPVSVKAGQHTVFWGDSLLLGGAIHGVDYAQNSLDIWKGLATPGAEAKELFRPRGGLTIQAQVTNELSLAGQWFYNWQAVRYPESGSYLTVNDALNFGGNSLIVGANPFAASIPGAPALLRAWNTQSVAASRYSGSIGDFGLSARWSPVWLDGTMGFYYRNATDIQPQLLLTPGLVSAGVPPATCVAIGGTPLGGTACLVNKNATTVADLQKYGKFGTYSTAYGDNIHIMGLTIAKNIAGVSVGGELSYRQNMPLISDPVTVLPAPLVNASLGQIATTAIPTHGTPGALGDTMHGVLNAVATLPQSPLFDTATLQGEFTWMQWLNVTQNEAVFEGRDSYTAINRVSKNYYGLAFNVTPTWFQVFPGVDMLMPLSWGGGIKGNAAVTSGGNANAGSWAVGVAADVYSRYRVDLKYTGYYGQFSTGATGAASVFNGVYSSLADRGFVSLTAKATF
jgi:Protein of unknown function (DUF1302)